jgi:hypothetical protein
MAAQILETTGFDLALAHLDLLETVLTARRSAGHRRLGTAFE